MKVNEKFDTACTWIGGAVLVLFAVGFLLGRTEQFGWKIHAIWIAGGVVLALPFEETVALMKTAKGYLPFGRGDDH